MNPTIIGPTQDPLTNLWVVHIIKKDTGKTKIYSFLTEEEALHCKEEIEYSILVKRFVF